MSGFSADWLGLREPADTPARDGGLLARLGAHFAGRDSVRVLDLGCGTGANLRATAPALPPGQSWHLIDHDPQLLQVARQQTAKQTALRVTFEAADLAADLERLTAANYDLVTASALFDLVSEAWLERLVAALAARATPLYTTLIYDGAMSWEPPHPGDAAIVAAFNAHQHGDKGFGPACGPDAARVLGGLLERAGYRVTVASSPWTLGADSAALATAATAGIAEAARETGLVARGDVDGWLAMRAGIIGCRIGHVDLLALPGQAAARG